MSEADPDDMGSAELFVAKVRWRFASTIPDWPHEYTVRSWRPELLQWNSKASAAIELIGFVEAWPPPPSRAIYHNRYLVVGDFK